MKPGDYFLCYLVKLSRWCGLLEVTGDAFEDDAPIFADVNDPFTIRFRVKPLVLLDFEHSIPIESSEIWPNLSFIRDVVAGSFGWAQKARMRQSLVQLSEEDGAILASCLRKQQQAMRKYELDAADLRHITDRTVIRTEAGDVEVEVPDREETPLPLDHPTEIRESLRVQAKVAQLGATLGFTIWLPPGDRSKVLELMPKEHLDKVIPTLPITFDPATIKTIENIDVLWLQRRAIVHAFEIEHTTSIYSGLLRMADLLAMQPRLSIFLHIVAPVDRRDQVRKEVPRPVFSVLEGGRMSDRCSCISYDALSELLAQPNLNHMRETILEDFEEHFDPT